MIALKLLFCNLCHVSDVTIIYNDYIEVRAKVRARVVVM